MTDLQNYSNNKVGGEEGGGSGAGADVGGGVDGGGVGIGYGAAFEQGGDEGGGEGVARSNCVGYFYFGGGAEGDFAVGSEDVAAACTAGKD